MDLADKLKNMPTRPGVYLHKNAKGKIIYIGKAKNLRNRVRQYFQSKKHKDYKTKQLMSRIADFEFIVVDNEVEALVLEANLVKKHKPRYNVFLKDDKQYPHLKITNEEFPKAVVTRKLLKDGAKYYGPFLPANLVRKTLNLINRTFQLRTCTIEIDGSLQRPCLEYHLKRCLGPCVKSLCTEEEYREAVSDAILLMDGKNKELATELEERMWHFSEKENFEIAAKYRDLSKTVLALEGNQKMATTPDRDVDIFGFYKKGNSLALQLFTMREGKIVGRREFFWEDLDEKDFDVSEFLGDVLSQYYSTDYVPLEINVPEDFAERKLLAKALTERRGRKVRIHVPKIGKKRRMIELLETNAKIAYEQRFRVLKPKMEKVLAELQETLELARFPEVIDSFDISNIQGSENVAGIVSYENGKPNRSEYRRYKIKTVEGQDDFASMNEAVFRRYRRKLEEKKDLPDLIFIDGGKGQLSAAGAAMADLDLEAIPLVGLVKPPRKHNEISHLLVFGREQEPVQFDPTSPMFRLVQEIRDETHRVAIQYHRKRREMRDFSSELEAIPGVGPTRRRRLLKTFGSIERIAQTSINDLKPVVGNTTAHEIHSHFEKQRKLAEKAEKKDGGK
ncbi:MAG: excinuclease ABC subunit UvrC [Pyrinomonadaceae bacterium]|nr:excinuclease ABC subunit UvrC [Pyrinomonadaceae bacterium]